MKKIAIIFCGLLLTLLLSDSSIWGQEQADEVVGERIYISPGPVFNPDSIISAMADWTSWVRVYNTTSAPLTIENFQWPASSSKRPDKLLSPSDSVTYNYYFPQDIGIFKFRIAGTPSDTLTVLVVAARRCCPSLTQPGMIILIILIIAVSIYLWIRRKTVTT